MNAFRSRIMNLAPKHHGELARRIAANDFEFAPGGAGLIVPKMGDLLLRGAYRHAVNGGDVAIDHNLATIEGRTNILGVYFVGAAATATHYFAPFSGDVTPLETWTASGAGSTPIFATAGPEFTAYTNATRPAFAPNAAASASVGNTGALTTFTLNAGGNIYGMGLLSVSAKSAQTGRLVTVARFATPRVGLLSGDVFSVEYIIDAT